MISLQPPALGCLATPRFTVVPLALAFVLSFPFLTFPLGALHLPDVHRRRRVWSRVSPMIVVRSLCQCPLSHVCTQGIISLSGITFKRSR